MNIYDIETTRHYLQDLQDRRRSPAPQAIVRTGDTVHAIPVAIHVLPDSEMGHEDDHNAHSPFEITLYVFCRDFQYQQATRLTRDYMDNPSTQDRTTTAGELALCIDRIAGEPPTAHVVMAQVGHTFRETYGSQPAQDLVLHIMQELRDIMTQRIGGEPQSPQAP